MLVIINSHCRKGNPLSLDRRRLEAAHLKYAALKVMKRYPEVFKQHKINIKLTETLESITKDFYTAFTLKYSGKHCNNKSLCMVELGPKVEIDTYI